MPSLRESDLIFHFPDHWFVRAYDQESFYLRMSGLGVKGVDFVALDPLGSGHVYFIEVKNYRTRETKGGRFESREIAPEILGQTVAVKYEHSQRAIRALQLHYRRKWWYKLFTTHWRNSRRYHAAAVFWTKVFHCLQDSSAHTLLLWLEMEQEDDSFKEKLRQVLRYELATGQHFLIGNRNQETVPGIIVEHVNA